MQRTLARRLRGGRQQFGWLAVCSLLATGGLLVAPRGGLWSAEIQLRDACQPQGFVVRLADVARVVSSDPQEVASLEAVELFAAPPPGSCRVLRAGQLRDLLRVAGVNLIEHRLSGSSQVAVGQGARGRPSKPSPPAVGTRSAREVENVVAQAIVAHLTTVSGRDEPWQVDVDLDDAQLRCLAASSGPLQLRGGGAPWVGLQRFEMQLPAGTEGCSQNLLAVVSLPPAVVVAVDSLPAGAVLQTTDLQLVRQPPKISAAAAPVEPLGSLEEALGMQTTRAIAAGQVVDRRSVRKPIVVRRNEVVTVFARAPGIEVRTLGRARDDGSQGDLVLVEGLSDRTRYFARVTGPRELEVYAAGVRAGL